MALDEKGLRQAEERERLLIIRAQVYAEQARKYGDLEEEKRWIEEAERLRSKARWLADCSPEFQAETRERETAEFERERSRVAVAQSVKRFEHAVGRVLLAAFWIIAVLALVYGAVKFVKWAWNN
jgi:hypothetical protein